jgi:DNA-binding LacI/PurR family transcriptional regulator/DNA-binding transcriptional regulator YhcF (GntR family)
MGVTQMLYFKQICFFVFKEFILMHPSTRRAYDYLHDLLAGGKIAQGDRMPPVRSCARVLHLSTLHIVRAMEQLKGEGLISVFPRGGAFAGMRKQPSPPISSSSRRQSVRIRIEEDLRFGAFDSLEQLPSKRAMCGRYGISWPLMSSVINDLVNEGVLTPHNQKFLICRPSVRGSYSSVLLLGQGHPRSGRIKMLNIRFQEFHLSFETECISRGITFEHAGVLQHQGPHLRASSRGKDSHIGYVLWNASETPSAQFQSLIARLSRTSKPVAIVDENGSYMLPPQVRGAGHVRVFSIAAQSAGRAVARFLMQGGHRNVAYISPYHRWQWSQQRLEGLAQAFSDAGMPGALYPCTIDSPAMSDPGIAEDLYKMSNRLFTRLGTLSTRNGVRFQSGIEGIRSAVQTMADIENAARLLRPLFEKARARKDTTAWVVANDHVCTSALDFLNEKKIPVGGPLWLIGFDNSELAYEHDLTSYNFNFSSIAKKVLSFIIAPRSKVFAGAPACIECEGVIIERKTTGHQAPKGR